MSRFHFYRYVTILVFGTLLFILSSVPSTAQVGPASLTPAEAAQLQCRPAVDRAMVRVGSSCNGLGNNAACYGYNRVGAIFSQAVGGDYFSSVADQADVPLIRRIQTTPNTLDSPDWGIAIMNVLANLPNALPGRGALLLMVGGANVESGLDEENTLAQAELPVTTSRTAFIRTFADPNSNVITQVPGAASLTADAQSEDGQWLRVVYGDDYGWISRVILESVEIDTLPILTDDALTPMQVFTFNTGIGRPRCGVAPDMLVIQTPRGRSVTFNINEADVTVGSTVILKTIGIDSEVLLDDGQVEVTRVDYHPDDGRVAVGYVDGFIRIWNVDNPGRAAARWQAHTDEVIGLRYVTLENRIVLITAGADGSVSIYDDNASPNLLYTLSNSTRAISSFAASSNRAALGHSDGAISLWDTSDGSMQLLVEISAHSGAVTALSFSADGLRLASGGADTAVRVWDTSEGAPLQTFTGHLRAITGLDFRPDGAEIASSSQDETIRLWNLSDNTLRQLNSGLVHSVQYSRDSRLLGAAADDDDFQIWVTETGIRQPPMVDHQDALSGVDFDSRGYYAVTGSRDQTARLWRVTPNLMRLIVADGQAAIGSLVVPAGYYSEVGLDESGERVIGSWSPVEEIDLRWTPEYYFLTQLDDELLLYEPVLPPPIIQELIRLGLLPSPGGPFPNTPTPIVLTPTPIIPITPALTPTIQVNPSSANEFSFGGRLFNDLNANGSQDVGESALEGFTIGVGENPIIDSIVTDESGDYTFSVEEGTYYLSFPTLTGFVYGSGIDPATGETELFTIDDDNPLPPVVPQFRQTVPFTDIAITASASTNQVETGEILEITYTLRNNGAQYATGVEALIYMQDNYRSLEHLSVDLSRGRAIVLGVPGASVGGYHTYRYTWRLGTLAPGQSETFVWRLQALPVATPAPFSTHFNAETAYDADDVDLNGANDSDIVSIDRLPDPLLTDVGIELGASVSQGTAGSPITYIVTVTNHGPYPADGITAALNLIDSNYEVDQLEQGNLQEVIEPPFGGYLRWSVGRLEEGESAQAAITTRLPYQPDFDSFVRSSVSLSNYEADAPSNAEPLENTTLDNDTSLIDIVLDGVVTTYETSLVLPNAPTALYSGDEVTFDWFVRNNGTQVIGDLRLFLFLPSQLTIEDVDGDDEHFFEGQKIWTVDTLEPGEYRQLRITVRINTEQGNVNQPLDLTIADNNAVSLVITVLPPVRDLGLTAEITPDEVLAGETAVLTYTVTNHGDAISEDVELNTSLAPDLTILSAAFPPEIGNFDSETGIWNIGTLSGGQTVELALLVQVSDDQPDPVLFMEGTVSTSSDELITVNNWWITYLYVSNYTDLSLQISTIRDDPTHIPEGEYVIFTLSVLNSSFVDATNVQVNIQIPDGLKLVYNDEDEVGDFTTYTITFDEIQSGQSAFYTLEALVDSGTVGQNLMLEAEVNGSDQSDTDSTPGNGANAEDDYAAYSFTVIAPIPPALPLLLGANERVEVTDEAAGIEVTHEATADSTQQDTAVPESTEETAVTPAASETVEVTETDEPTENPTAVTIEESLTEAPTATAADTLLVTAMPMVEAASVDVPPPEPTLTSTSPPPPPTDEPQSHETPVDDPPSEPAPEETVDAVTA